MVRFRATRVRQCDAGHADQFLELLRVVMRERGESREFGEVRGQRVDQTGLLVHTYERRMMLADKCCAAARGVEARFLEDDEGLHVRDDDERVRAVRLEKAARGEEGQAPVEAFESYEWQSMQISEGDMIADHWGCLQRLSPEDDVMGE